MKERIRNRKEELEAKREEEEANKLKQTLGLSNNSLIWVDFVPYLIWWFIFTYVTYTVAGEKMPWLSIHFTIPMALLSGWYINDRLQEITLRQLLSRQTLLLTGISILFTVATVLMLAPIWNGTLIGNQTADSLNSAGRFLGSLLIVGGLYYGWQKVREQTNPIISQQVWLFSSFILLSLITIRFSYLANFPNADYTNEFIPYAHGAPATKSAAAAAARQSRGRRETGC